MSPGVSDEAVEQLHAQVVTEFRRHGQYTLGLARAALEAAAPLMGATPRPTLGMIEQAAYNAILADDVLMAPGYSARVDADADDVAEAIAPAVLALLDGTEDPK